MLPPTISEGVEVLPTIIVGGYLPLPMMGGVMKDTLPMVWPLRNNQLAHCSVYITKPTFPHTTVFTNNMVMSLHYITSYRVGFNTVRRFYNN